MSLFAAKIHLYDDFNYKASADGLGGKDLDAHRTPTLTTISVQNMYPKPKQTSKNRIDIRVGQRSTVELNPTKDSDRKTILEFFQNNDHNDEGRVSSLLDSISVKVPNKAMEILVAHVRTTGQILLLTSEAQKLYTEAYKNKIGIFKDPEPPVFSLEP